MHVCSTQTSSLFLLIMVASIFCKPAFSIEPRCMEVASNYYFAARGTFAGLFTFEKVNHNFSNVPPVLFILTQGKQAIFYENESTKVPNPQL